MKRGAPWRERRLAWFLEQLDVLYEHSNGERYATYDDWVYQTAIPIGEFEELFAAAWDENFIGHHAVYDAPSQLAYEGYVLTTDGHRFLRFLRRETEARPVVKAPIPAELRWAIWERDNFTCQHCGSRQFLSVDHIVPEVRGGTLDPANLQTLCQSCNSRKGTR